MLPFRPLHPVFGALLHGASLESILASTEQCDELRAAVVKHRLVLLRGCGDATPERQLLLSKFLGTIESTFYRHPKSPHPDIFRVSNDDTEGCTNVGRSGWHLDGTFLPEPFAFQTMHFVSASRSGSTEFLPLREFFLVQPAATRALWSRTRFIVRNSRGLSHRLVRSHPETGEPTMVFHLGAPFCGGWALEPADETGTVTFSAPNELIGQIEAAIDASRAIPTEQLDSFANPLGVPSGTTHRDGLVLRMDWETGDLAILDNRAVAHYATEDTQRSAADDGLRVLHRTTVVL
jgi:taurine dioxygenase